MGIETRKEVSEVLKFLQTYGIWIVFGGLFLLMMRVHGAGGGCGMGHEQRTGQTTSKSSGVDGDAVRPVETKPGGQRSSGCH